MVIWRCPPVSTEICRDWLCSIEQTHQASVLSATSHKRKVMRVMKRPFWVFSTCLCFSSTTVVPVSLPSFDCVAVANKLVLEEIKDSIFVPCHNIGTWLCLDFAPYLRESILESLSDSRVRGTVWILPSNLESLSYRCILWLLAWSRKAACGNIYDRCIFAVRHWTKVRIICLVVLILMIVINHWLATDNRRKIRDAGLTSHAHMHAGACYDFKRAVCSL